MHGNEVAIERLFFIIRRRWILPHQGKDQTVQGGSRRFSLLPDARPSALTSLILRDSNPAGAGKAHRCIFQYRHIESIMTEWEFRNPQSAIEFDCAFGAGSAHTGSLEEYLEQGLIDCLTLFNFLRRLDNVPELVDMRPILFL
jgi:hypothetical protein